ncbi:hypothetical protein F4553_007599 [Allocatelliglobosispora scoriae]|uniref:Uncharacterized protein n=1 Tax=Allocatelliglobosispora scoriae TaxID=643052 RepID=A0A841C2M3_9ACTN|nr:hypothetical protein [Allocatelliglobosispora scoriae]MBB5874165.1 hypothetical protein [Allocatelliglobosispora scoriae]
MSLATATRRIGWLLRTSRRFGADEALRSGRTFARAFSALGSRPLAPSQITRWETGQLPLGREAIRRYEQLLHLTPESLVSVADTTMRYAADGASLRSSHETDDDLDRVRLFHMLDRVTGADALSGADWSSLTELVAARPQLELYPSKIWLAITDRLLDEMVDAVGIEWLQRQEAMSRLLRHPAARHDAVEGCIAHASDPTSLSIVEPLSLLNNTQDPVANRYVLRQLEHPDGERALEGALQAVIRKVSQQHFHHQESIRLVASLTSLMNDASTSGAVLALAVEAGRRLSRQPSYAGVVPLQLHTGPVVHDAWTARRSAEPTAAQVVSARIAARVHNQLAREAGSTDAILATLVEETMFHPDPDLSLASAMLIGATPYRIPFTQMLLDEVKLDLARQRGTYPLASALRALTLLGVDTHRPLVHDLLTKRGASETVRQAAAWATPFCFGRFPEPIWRQILTVQFAAWRQSPNTTNGSILHGIAFGIGTEGHRSLLAYIREHPHAPQTARAAAASWLLRT